MNAKNKMSEAPLVSIVDDDISVRRSTLRLLRSSGLRAETFASGEEFLQSEILEQTACLVLDLSMPVMNGLELQLCLVDTGRLIPIVFLSARASDEEERRAMEAGAASFLRKPVSKEVLLHAIRAAIEGPTINHERNYDDYHGE
jgi:FixJ family two-component response regulator